MNSVSKHLINNQEFTLIEISKKAIQITFMDYGASVMNILVPDSNGTMESILLSYEKLDSYIGNSLFLNATIGPISGRISNAKFKIKSQVYNLEKNFLGTTSLHGGQECFAFKFFKYEIKELHDKTQVIFEHFKEEKTLGTPGNQNIKIIYTIYDSYFSIDFEGTTDKDTLLNLTNHNYFNLSGNLKDSILNHTLQVNTNKYMTLDSNFVPKIVTPTALTSFDFFNETVILESLTKEIKESKEKGIDNPFLLKDVGIEYKQITLKDPVSKRVLDIYTSYPCVVIYTDNFPDKSELLNKVNHVQHLGICFETQNVPNGINLVDQESSILKKDEKYSHQTIYKFSTY